MKFVVSFGGGVTSYEALRRTIVKHGRENTVAVFADVGQVRDEQGRVVCGEDDDLYRFMGEVEQLLGIQIHRVKSPDYTDVWDVFFRDRFLGNSLSDPCSKRMKRDVLRRWITANFLELSDVLVVGLDWTELDRVNDYAASVQPWRTEFPLCEEPRVSKQKIALDLLNIHGIEPPGLYHDGFSHNNCGGACVKAGHAQWYRLWLKRPWVFRWWEHMEQIFRIWISEHTILKKITLKALREKFEAGYIPRRHNNEGCGGACIIWNKGELKAA